MIKKVLSILLMGLIFSPQLIQLQHAFSDHKHPTCQIAKHHLHEVNLDCDFGDYFHTSHYVISPFYVQEVFVVPAHKTPQIYKSPIVETTVLQHKLLRGPPIFS